MLEVEQHVTFRGVEAVEHGRAFEAVRIVGSECVDPQEVGSTFGLDAHNGGAVLGEVPR